MPQFDTPVLPDRAAPASPAPRVSVVMANHRGAAHLAASMRSVLDQTEGRLELILADDASDDDSLAIANGIARGDDRVRVLPSARNEGPAATRNRALDAARGEWIAVVDSDDLIHPERLARLIAAAQAQGADLAADDLVHFGSDEARTLLQPLSPTRPAVLTTTDLLRGNAGGAGVPAYGYLKPLIRRASLGTLRYDRALRIGEDYDLILRMVMAGARFLLLPDPLYAYRRHAGSISHRLSVDTVAAMLAAHRALPPMPDAEAQEVAAAVGRQLAITLRYERLVAAIKGRRWGSALPALADPAMLARLAGSVMDRRRRQAAAVGGAAAARSGVRPPCPPMPEPGAVWDSPPAPAAAWIVAAVQAGDGRDTALADLPPWAQWLAETVRPAAQSA